MSDTDFNLLDSIEQIRTRELKNLAGLDEIARKSEEVLPEIEKIRRASLEALQAIDEISERERRKGKP